MDKMREVLPAGAGRAILIAVLLAVGVALFAAAWAAIPYVYGLSTKADFTYSQEVFPNPLTGFARSASSSDIGGAERQLVYIDLTWAQWEPQRGVYDIAGFEERNKIPFWKARGRHAVLRFVCDKPGSEPHMDIPQWLFDETGDGVFYDNDYGKGYAPAYDDPVFLEAHQAALAALGQYCSQDSFVSFVELGSLGHWGEWHVKTGEDLPPMPDADVCWDYANQYSDSFVNARLLMRRPYTMAVSGGMGVYNDMTGHEEDTLEWLRWQSEGGEYSYAGNTIPYEPVEAIWDRAPVGGEFTSSIPMTEMLGSRLETTLSLLDQSHMTFLGPKVPVGAELEMPGATDVLRHLGYRFWISHMDVRYHYFGNAVTLSLTWENSGAAPMYFQWPVMLYIYDTEGQLRYWSEVDVDLTQLGPGKSLVSTCDIPFSDDFRQGYSVGVAILDPMTEQPAVRLAMDAAYEDGINYIYTYQGS